MRVIVDRPWLNGQADDEGQLFLLKLVQVHGLYPQKRKWDSRGVSRMCSVWFGRSGMGWIRDVRIACRMWGCFAR